ncbi:hypothetical protein PVAP13_5KG166314 [Panicum virgatum]|uniref:Uncharacterized protein n=1 Tax=Panicum virgatum TaxID=38727 RepID=A0A8T0SE99_PANVG|nr:hypothetical protein PVAP13_5KG166314 [Panicum virgatum]
MGPAHPATRRCSTAWPPPPPAPLSPSSWSPLPIRLGAAGLAVRGPPPQASRGPRLPPSRGGTARREARLEAAVRLRSLLEPPIWGEQGAEEGRWWRHGVAPRLGSPARTSARLRAPPCPCAGRARDQGGESPGAPQRARAQAVAMSGGGGGEERGRWRRGAWEVGARGGGGEEHASPACARPSLPLASLLGASGGKAAAAARSPRRRGRRERRQVRCRGGEGGQATAAEGTCPAAGARPAGEGGQSPPRCAAVRPAAGRPAPPRARPRPTAMPRRRPALPRHRPALSRRGQSRGDGAGEGEKRAIER